MAQRVTQAPRVTVTRPDPTVRVTQAVQMVVAHPDPTVRVTQVVRIAIVRNVAPDGQSSSSRWVD